MSLKKRFYSIIMILILFCSNIWAQKTDQDFNFVNIKEGISKVGIYSITQDNYGFIWIGTNGSGLYKFDGIDYTSYKFKHEDSTSISSNLIFSSYLGKNNDLWVGTEEGLNLYDRDLDRFKKIELNEANISVLSINEDNNGNLYIGSGFGLFKFNLKTRKAVKIPNKDAVTPGINSIQINDDGVVFLGTSIGLRQIDTISNQIVKPKTVQGISDADFDAPIQYMLIDTENNIWAGTYGNGVYKYKLQNKDIVGFSQFPISSKRILSLVELPDNSFLAGSENDGLFHMNSDGSLIKTYLHNKTDENSIRSNSIWSLFMDSNERIWMGYYNNGIAISDKLFDKFNNIESLSSNSNSLQTGSVTGIVKDDKYKLWISMDGGGIDVFDVKTSKMDHINLSNNKLYSGLTSDYIQTIFIDSRQNIWAGSWDNGIYILKKGEKTFTNINVKNSNGKLLSNAILSIDEDNDGIIWIGAFYNGLYSFNLATNELKNYNSKQFVDHGITTSDVRKVLVDSDETIWLGTTAGLFKIDKVSGDELSITPFSKRMSEAYNNLKSSNHILSLYQSSNNYIWIGTRGAGLCRYDKKKDVFKWYNKFSGLNEENIAGIIEDQDGHIWVSGNSGISKLNIATNAVTNYTTNDGLLSDDFNFNATLKDDDGILYFGNYKGIDYFNPKDLIVNSSVPSLYLTGLKIFNKEVVPNKEDSPLFKVISETNSLEFNHKESVFTIEYTGINYTRPEKNQYAYYLEGLEESWNYVGNKRSATYTNLDYGDYTFKLKAANNDGIWNETPLTLKITILPPWWKTKIAVVCYIVLFFLALFLLNILTQARVKEKEMIRNERIQRVQEDKLSEKKIQFFTNISHEFRTPLTLIINPLQDVLKDATLNLPFSVKERLNIVYKNTERLYRLINELMDFRKLELNKVNIKVEKFNLVDFSKEMVSYFKEEAYNRNICLTIDADVPNLPVWADESMLEKIIFNLLSNAFKVTPDGGAISIEILSTEEPIRLPLVDEVNLSKAIEIRISDTGPGLEKDQLDKIFQRFYQVDRINKTYYGGTGIGLEVVQNFVSLHKGEIEVESSLGQGTSFRVLLPEGKKHFNDKEFLSASVVKPSGQKKFVLNIDEDDTVSKDEQEAISKSKTLLIVEDSAELRNYLKRELKNSYKILVANNGVEGLRLAEKASPDIIITDVIMPEMNGFEFCNAIKSDIKTSHIPLLMLTAKTRIEDRIEGVGFGADAYMVKPFDMRLLKLRLVQLIKSRQSIFDKYFGDVSGKEESESASSIAIDKEFIQKVLKYVNDNMSDTELSVELLASQVSLSRSRLYRKIKGLTGQTVTEFIRKVRLQRAKQILEKGNSNISEVCYKVGFSSPSYFTKCFKAHFGILPTDVEVKES
ncbi:hybrid sensor histidine kinase/response regulator transcription factor [Flavivirga eckloniae]|uniref:histidine kinase n=1 Tax=Flavivirga eckloniae TaxID=1803846 RepID=A0A2K9PLH2_9FLAO|nr:hybrid sensor histidine kinase/response regulator transcription factor [Flavivirga eckloniae]AUP77902.1 hybrid sensor histidine kinase/response regulator [Flavivirga eckloniae]